MVDENNSSQGRPAGKTLVIAGMVAALVAIVLLVLWIFSPSDEPEPRPPEIPQQAEPEPEPEPEPVEPEESAPPPEPEEPPEEPLPPLGESDEVIREELAQLRNGSQLLDLLVTDDVIRKTVRAVTAAKEGALVNKYRPVTELEEPFEAEPVGGPTGENEQPRYRMSEESYERYDARVNLLSSMNPESLVAVYQRYYPLLEEAYQEQGVEQGSFHDVVQAAIDNMLAAPIIEKDILLVQPSVMYRYADPELEALPPVQKLMLRMGPDNSRKLKAVLRRLQAELDSL